MITMLMFAALQAVTSPDASKPPLLVNPQAVLSFWDYPAASLRERESGIVSFLVAVSADGKVTKCDITETSHFSALDLATCQRIKTRARFDPAQDTNGTHVAAEYRGAVAWGAETHFPDMTMDIQLQLASLPAGYTTPTKAQLTFDGSGRVTRCEITAKSGSDDADRSLCEYVTREITIAAPKSRSRDVRPIGIRYVTGTLSTGPAPTK